MVAMEAWERPRAYETDDPPLMPPTAAPEIQPVEPGEVDDGVLVDVLLGVVVHTDRNMVRTSVPRQPGLHLADHSLVSDNEFKQRIAAEYLGKPLTLNRVRQIVAAYVKHLRKNGHMLVDVVIPEQDVTNGMLQLLVVQGTFGELTVEGNQHFSDHYFLQSCSKGKATTWDLDVILDCVNWLNRNPFATTTLSLVPGEAFGVVDLKINVTDQVPYRIYSGYGNTGNDLIGEDIYSLGFLYGDLWGLGHQLSYHVGLSGDGHESLLSQTLRYEVPLPGHNELEFTYYHSSSSLSNEDLTTDGGSELTGIFYKIPFNRFENYAQEIGLGLEWKESRNALEFGLTRVRDTTTRLGQLAFNYSGTYFAKRSITEITFKARYGLNDHLSIDSSTFSLARDGAEPDYAYGSLSIAHAWNLPRGWTILSRLHAQKSTDNLLSSEQMSLGGYHSIRGYDEREVYNVDEGGVLRTELQFPSYGFKELTFRAGLFVDYGYGRARRGRVLLANGGLAEDIDMASVGPFLRATLGGPISFFAEYGEQLESVGSTQGRSKLHVGVQFCGGSC